MLYPEDTKPMEYADKAEDHLIFDGTANLDYSDDIPQVKGLIELLNQYFSDKPDQHH